MSRIKKDNVGRECVIARPDSRGAAVHIGFLEKAENGEVTLINARRIWYWKGAASLSELATKGTSDPNSCKFPPAVLKVTMGYSELNYVTEEAYENIKNVKEWTQH